MILSILIPSIPEHFESLEKLQHELHTQIIALNDTHPTLGKVEVLIDNSIRYLEGGLSIGKKREGLYRRCNGKYSCCVDADDWVSPNYVETLVRLCQQDKDVCTFRAITKNDFYWSVIDMSMHYYDNEATPEGLVKRDVWHVCPIRSSIAKQFDFPDISYGEDIAWLNKVRKHIYNEAKTNAILLEYRHSSKTSEADKITNYVQSVK